MSNIPKISVVMTAYNAELYIREAIDSILNQTFSNFEFIIVDNCSTDDTQDIIKSYSDERIVFIANAKNVGQTKALNIGLQKSRTDYIARMDADDVCVLERLQLQYDFLEERRDIAVVGSSWIYINEEGEELRTYKTLTDPIEIRCALSASGDLTSWCMPHPVILARKTALLDVGFYTEEAEHGYPQDYDLWAKLLVKGYRFANIEKPLLKYRILDSSESRGSENNQLLAYRFEITLRKIKALVGNLENADDLARMLEFQPQMSPQAGEIVFKFFDRYFEAFIKDILSGRSLSKYQTQIKLYYLPQLFKTNKFLSIRSYLKFVFKYPSLLFDGRFIRKIGKSRFGRQINQTWYHQKWA